MQTLAIISNKGGVGKTTLALHLACELTRRGSNVVVVDLDPQSSAAFWADRRKDAGYESLSVADVKPSRLDRALDACKGAAVDYVIIDTAPHSNEIALKAISVSDHILIPCTPSLLDIAGTEISFDMIRSGSKMNVTSIVLNGVAPHGKEEDSCRDYFRNDAEVHVFKTTLGYRKIFKRSIAFGQDSFEVDKSSKAALEVQALTDEIKEWING